MLSVFDEAMSFVDITNAIFGDESFVYSDRTGMPRVMKLSNSTWSSVVPGGQGGALQVPCLDSSTPTACAFDALTDSTVAIPTESGTVTDPLAAMNSVTDPRVDSVTGSFIDSDLRIELVKFSDPLAGVGATSNPLIDSGAAADPFIDLETATNALRS
jgi:hypothetical protein